MDKRKAVDMIYLDFNKASEAVPHGNLRATPRTRSLDVMGAEGRLTGC